VNAGEAWEKPAGEDRELVARRRQRAWSAVAIVVTIAAGLASRKFAHVFPAAVAKYPGDALWALMVFFGLGFIFPKAGSVPVGLGALGFSVAIEVLKLWQAPWLVQVRHTTVGHLVFGHVFSWQNLVAYAVGVSLGVAIEKGAFSGGIQRGIVRSKK